MTLHGQFGLRPEAVPAWRSLASALATASSLGLRTPCDDDPESFVGDDLIRRQVAAKACTLCPIRRQCGEFGSQNIERIGVWGGRDRTWGAAAELARHHESGER